MKMGFLELFLIGIGLSMDAFAVAVCKGLNMRKIKYSHTLIIACFFGGFQALMPLIGWFLGSQFESYITSIDHWIAFVFLAFIGFNMIKESLSEEEKATENVEEKLDIKELLVLSIATSIDALAVGITFAFLKIDILSAITLIGCTTFVLAIIGVLIGYNFGSRYQSKAQFAGGVILVLIGLKILLEHLGILG